MPRPVPVRADQLTAAVSEDLLGVTISGYAWSPWPQGG